MKDPFAALVLGQANDQGRKQCSSSFKCVSHRKAAADSCTLHILKVSFNPKPFSAIAPSSFLHSPQSLIFDEILPQQNLSHVLVILASNGKQNWV